MQSGRAIHSVAAEVREVREEGVARRHGGETRPSEEVYIVCRGEIMGTMSE